MKNVVLILVFVSSLSSFAQDANGFVTFEPYVSGSSIGTQIRKQNAQVQANGLAITFQPFINNSSTKWITTTGWHSDGTSKSIRYDDNYIQIFYNNEWYITDLYYDEEYKRYYVKTPANKRYYIQI